MTKATNAVNNYYYHILEHPSHQNNEFWENFIEHFGTYTLYNVLPYTSSNIASSHNMEHQQACANNLLCDLIPYQIVLIISFKKINIFIIPLKQIAHLSFILALQKQQTIFY